LIVLYLNSQVRKIRSYICRFYDTLLTQFRINLNKVLLLIAPQVLSKSNARHIAEKIDEVKKIRLLKRVIGKEFAK